MGPFSPHFASGVATRATKPHHVTHLCRLFSIDRSSLTGRRTVWSPSQGNTSALSSTYVDPAHTSPLDSIDPTPAHSVGTVGMQHATVPEINLRNVLYILTTPYDLVAWKNTLEHCNITPESPISSTTSYMDRQSETLLLLTRRFFHETFPPHSYIPT